MSGHEYYLEVPEEFIDDEFNLTGLSVLVPYYIQALEMILDMECGEFFEVSEDSLESEDTAHNSLTRQAHDDDFFWKEENKRPKQQRATDSRLVEPYAFMLYGLIHARYLCTRDGIRLMAERYTHSEFGTCPRYYCDKSPVLPMGRYDEIGKECVHLFCPQCLDLYHPPTSSHQNVDGNKTLSVLCFNVCL